MGAHPSVSELLDNAASLDKQEFESFFNKMVLLRAQRHPAVLPKEEFDLLQKINIGFPQDKWERIELLNGKLENEILSEAEHTELMALIDKYEAHMVRRVRYLGRLATLRKISLNELIEQLGIAPKYHD